MVWKSIFENSGEQDRLHLTAEGGVPPACAERSECVQCTRAGWGTSYFTKETEAQGEVYCRNGRHISRTASSGETERLPIRTLGCGADDFDTDGAISDPDWKAI